jgi:hypothetical protein
MLELFYATGIRRTEMANLDHGDYDSSARTLLVHRGKNGKSRLLPVGERAAAWRSPACYSTTCPARPRSSSASYTGPCRRGCCPLCREVLPTVDFERHVKRSR